MKKNDISRKALQKLRKRAEAAINGSSSDQAALDPGGMPEGEGLRLFHELDVHRIELEMQNEELLKTQDELEELLDNYTDLFDYAPIGYLIVQRFGTISGANLTAGTMLREERDRLIGAPMQSFIVREDQDQFYLLRRAAETKAGAHGCEIRMKRRGGMAFHARMDCIAIAGEEGSTALRISFSDISSLKKAEQALREREAWTHAVLDAAVSGIIAIGEKGVIELVNPAAVQMFGYEPGEMVGQNVTMLMPESYRRGHEVGLRKYLDARRLLDIRIPREVEGRRKDGRVFPMEMTLREITTHPGRTVIGFVTDITERKQIERVRKTFCAIAGHELRTPATNISLALDMLTRGEAGELPEKVGELVDVAHRGSERLKRMISDMLEYQRYDLGELDFELVPLEIMSQVEEAVSANRAAADQFAVVLAVSSSAPDARVVGDAGRLIQVLDNLLSNAIRFSPEGGTVTVDVSRPDGCVRVAVTDNGPGLSEEFRPMVFEPFAQESSSLEDPRNKESVGLGLVIAKAIVEKLGGRIGFVSQPWVATTFWVELPEYHPQQGLEPR